MTGKKGLMAVVLGLTVLMAGCATYWPQGFIYTEVKGPAAVGSEGYNYSKTGTATANSILGMVATGDCSIKAAMANGKINKVKYVEYSVKNVLGLFGEYTTTVYGD